MRVYRIEHPETKRGPYDAWGLFSKAATLCGAHSLGVSEKHPPAPLDVPRFRGGVDVCGLASQRDVFRWFGGYLPLILRDGFTVVVLEVPDARVKVGTFGQVAFPRDAARVVGRKTRRKGDAPRHNPTPEATPDVAA